MRRLGNEVQGESFAEHAKLDASALKVTCATSLDWDFKHTIVKRASTGPYNWAEFIRDPLPFQIQAEALFHSTLDLVGAPLHPEIHTENQARQLLSDVQARTGFAHHGPWLQHAEMAEMVTATLKSVRDDFLSAHQHLYHERFWDSCAAAALGLGRKDAVAGGGIPILSAAQWAPLPKGTPEAHCPIEHAVEAVEEGVRTAVQDLPRADPRRYDVTLYQRAAEAVLDEQLRGDAGAQFFAGSIEKQKAIVHILGTAVGRVCLNILPRKRPRQTAEGAADNTDDQAVQVYLDEGSAGHKPKRTKWR
jgi:hypothetical protein